MFLGRYWSHIQYFQDHIIQIVGMFGACLLQFFKTLDFRTLGIYVSVFLDCWRYSGVSKNENGWFWGSGTCPKVPKSWKWGLQASHLSKSESYKFQMEQNLPGLGRGRFRSGAMCSWHWSFTLVRTFFWNICNWSQSKQHVRTSFWKKEQWKQIRARFWARTFVSCLRSAHARRPLWERPEMLIVFRFDARDPLF